MRSVKISTYRPIDHYVIECTQESITIHGQSMYNSHTYTIRLQTYTYKHLHDLHVHRHMTHMTRVLCWTCGWLVLYIHCSVVVCIYVLPFSCILKNVLQFKSLKPVWYSLVRETRLTKHKAIAWSTHLLSYIKCSASKVAFHLMIPDESQHIHVSHRFYTDKVFWRVIRSNHVLGVKQYINILVCCNTY